MRTELERKSIEFATRLASRGASADELVELCGLSRGEAELLSRGHAVTVLARNPGKLAPQPGLTVVAADALDAAQVAAAVAGHDAVVSAYNPGWTEPRIYDLFLQGTRAIIEGVKQAGLKRLLVVGGAGSLFVAPGVQLVDTPEFPAEWKAGALAARDYYIADAGDGALVWIYRDRLPAAPGTQAAWFLHGRFG